MWRYKRNMSVAPLLISAVASGHLKLNKFYFGFFIGLIQYFWIEFRYSYSRLIDDVSRYLGDGNTGDAPYAYLKYVEINLQSLT